MYTFCAACLTAKCVVFKLTHDAVVVLLQLTHWSLLDKLHCLALQTAAVTSALVLVFYWAYATGPTQSPLPGDYLRYAANVPIMLLDVFFSKVPFVSYHLQVMDLCNRGDVARQGHSLTGCLDCNVAEYVCAPHGTSCLSIAHCLSCMQQATQS